MLTRSLPAVNVAPGLESFAPVGAHVHDDGVTFRVWAPDHRQVRVVTGPTGGDTRYIATERDAAGYFTGRDEHGRAGDLYWCQLDDKLAPDPASRFQPLGVDGPSMVVDPASFRWRATEWRRPPLRGRVIYELHVGAFTPEGTFRGAIERLDALVDLGVNTIELMPVGDFAGRRNWGYDGVMLYAPARCYGTPDDLRALVDAAHERGLAVILDVVYNHLGPVGNVLGGFARDYFHRSKANPWGDLLNFDDENAAPVRRFFLQNACLWLDEYRIDGLRLDAVHAIEDNSRRHIMAEIAAAARVRGAFTIAEDERNDAALLRPVDAGGWGLSGMWSDDFHHSVRVALTGEQGAHYANYRGAADEWVQELRDGWLYSGQHYPVWKKPRGTSSAGLAPEQFVFCISNHDQVGNRPRGDRLHEVVAPAAYRAASMLLCFAPQTPMLFMGQEWATNAPFPFFTDFPGELGPKMAGYRIREFESRGGGYPETELRAMPDPQDEDTFRRAKLDWAEREREPHAAVLRLYRECLRLRAAHPVFRSAPRDQWSMAAVGEHAVAIRWFDERGDWLLLAVLKPGEHRMRPTELARARGGRRWRTVLASEEARFGGGGAKELMPPDDVVWAGPAAVLLREAQT